LLSELRLENFRNLESLVWNPAPGPQLLLGGNGVGKTSLLEAVYLLATTRSFRTTQVAECVRHGASRFELQGEVEGAARTHLLVRWVDKERSRRVNGNTTSLSEHLAVLPIVAWTGKDTEILTGPPALRRRFLDRGVLGCRSDGLAVLARYRKILAQKRQALLNRDRTLGLWNELLAQAAVTLMEHRRAYVDQLRQEVAEVLESCSLGLPAISLEYKPSFTTEVNAEEAYARLEKLERQELALQRPLVGPHRDDLVILWGEQALRGVASAGERKVLGLALISAHGRVLSRVGRTPIYLLDDADTELAADTLQAIWKAFEGPVQVLASSNRPDVWKDLSIATVWHLEKGRFVSE